MTEQPCPHDEQLASFVRCELSEEVAANVLDHLDNCPHCEETVANLEHTIKSVLPGAAGTMIDVPYSDESACQRAIQSLVSEFATPSSVADPGTFILGERQISGYRRKPGPNALRLIKSAATR